MVPEVFCVPVARVQVDQLNLVRESNSALREEAAANLREAGRWRSQASELEGAVGALKSTLHEKEAAAEGASRERDLAQQEAQRWKARADQVSTARRAGRGGRAAEAGGCAVVLDVGQILDTQEVDFLAFRNC